MPSPAIIEVANKIAQQAESLECRDVPIGALAEIFDYLMQATVVLESIQPED
jgi:hypothetical protein